jgi:hypothetical protein
MLQDISHLFPIHANPVIGYGDGPKLSIRLAASLIAEMNRDTSLIGTRLLYGVSRILHELLHRLLIAPADIGENLENPGPRLQRQSGQDAPPFMRGADTQLNNNAAPRKRQPALRQNISDKLKAALTETAPPKYY